MQCRDGDSHGLEIAAGRHINFVSCAFEGLGGRGINITSATETVARITFHDPYLEGVGTSGNGDHGIYINASDTVLDGAYTGALYINPIRVVNDPDALYVLASSFMYHYQ